MIKEFIIKVATEHQINSVDVTAAGGGVLVWLKYAPDIAATFTVLWLGLRIFIAVRDEILGKKKKDVHE